MKRNTLLKTIALMLVIALCSSIPATAFFSKELELSDKVRQSKIPLETKTIISWEDKISPQLFEEMERVANSDSPNDKMKVYVWYNDIDQTLVDQRVEIDTGITRDSVNTDLQMPDDELLDLLSKSYSENFENTAENTRLKNEMEAYLKTTEKEREAEKQLTDTYNHKRREVSKEMYKAKGNVVKRDLKVESNDLAFQSKYAPMLITEMTYDVIVSAAQNPQIETLNLFVELEGDLIPPDTLYEMKEINGFNKLYVSTGLTGKNVKVGILDHGVVITDATELPSDRIKIIGNIPTYFNSGVVDDNNHAVNSARIAVGKNGIAPSAQVFSVGWSYTGYYESVEALLDQGVSVINSSINIGHRYGRTYSTEEKWIDHIVCQSWVSYVQSAGNDAKNEDLNISPILNLGLAYNVITVGAMNDSDTIARTDHRLYEYSSYNHLNGCYKPDLLAPANVLGGGTSSAAPVVSGTIALMLELKPSLKLYPEVIKAVLLASCDRKVKDPVTGTQTEFMTSGLTNKQGAGVFNPIVAIDILSKEQYRSLILSQQHTSVIKSQSEDGTQLNVSLAWIQSHETIQDIDLFVNSDLTYYSAKSNSSTEMVCFDTYRPNGSYSITISNYLQNSKSVYFAYAWSANDTAYKPYNYLDGTYYIKNVRSNLYLDIHGGQAYKGANIIQNQFTGAESQKFKIVIKSDGYYMIEAKLDSERVITVSKDPIWYDENGANIELDSEQSGTNQKFAFILNENKSYRIASKCTQASKVLTVQGASSASGANVIQHQYNATHDDEWILVPCN